MTITAGIVFLVRTVVEHWRWQRAMKAQTDLNTKLIDRFASSEDLLAYLQSPQGKTLTERPALPQAAPRAMVRAAEPHLLVDAVGHRARRAGRRPHYCERGVRRNRTRHFLNGVGIVVLMIGIGFAVSAVVSYLLSQRLGLVQSLSARYSGDTPPS